MRKQDCTSKFVGDDSEKGMFDKHYTVTLHDVLNCIKLMLIVGLICVYIM